MKRKSLFKLIAIITLSITVFSCKEDEDVKVTGISLDPKTATVRVGSQVEISPSVQPVDATSKEILWNSKDESVATVAGGKITGVAIGSTWIVAVTKDGGYRDSVNVTVDPAAGSTVTLSGNITADIHLKADVNYVLDGWVYIKNGAAIHIEAGTVIKGKSGTKASLIIERGAKIMAEGTASKPIVFTSDKAAGSRNAGDWGGIIICGKAKINPTGGEAEIEGGVGSLYGGTNDDDNSGILKYVRIEFAGYAFATDKEINGLTLGGVGRGTKIEYVQVSYSNDDSFEWFGGTVNCKYLIAFGGLDDDFDTDYGFSGMVQYAVGLRMPSIADISKSNGFESDNDATGSTNTPVTNPKFANVSLYGPKQTLTTTSNALYQAAMHLRRKTSLEVYNSVFAGWPVGLIMADSKGNAGNIQIKGCVFSGMVNNYNNNTAGEETFFTDASRSNRMFAENSSLQVNAPFNTATPNFIPAAGSPLLSGAVTLPAGFEPTDYVGAFKATDWTTGWANWDPKNAAY